jgi:hypothetical protein
MTARTRYQTKSYFESRDKAEAEHAAQDLAEGWNDFLPAAYVELAGGDPENNAYYM